VPDSTHQGLDPATGTYVYAVTPLYFDDKQAMLPLDATLTASVSFEVCTFTTGTLAVGNTRGFTQSQAFVRHFGLDALIRPKGDELQFDTSAICGTNVQGQSYTYAQQHQWSGFTARKLVSICSTPCWRTRNPRPTSSPTTSTSRTSSRDCSSSVHPGPCPTPR